MKFSNRLNTSFAQDLVRKSHLIPRMAKRRRYDEHFVSVAICFGFTLIWLQNVNGSDSIVILYFSKRDKDL